MGVYMNTRYLIICVCVCVVGAYFCGAKIADAKCQTRFVKESLTQIEQHQKQNISNKRVLHETVYKTGVADIRRILQSKYTIAE